MTIPIVFLTSNNFHSNLQNLRFFNYWCIEPLMETARLFKILYGKRRKTKHDTRPMSTYKYILFIQRRSVYRVNLCKINFSLQIFQSALFILFFLPGLRSSDNYLYLRSTWSCQSTYLTSVLFAKKGIQFTYSSANEIKVKKHVLSIT